MDPPHPAAVVALSELAGRLGVGGTLGREGRGVAAAAPERRRSVLARVFLAMTARSASLRRKTFHFLFQYLARRSGDLEAWTQMNYGYAAREGDGHTLPLDAADEPERFCHQLHDRVAGAVDLAGREVAEVSCGRGGGAAFVHRSRGCRSMTGIDIASEAIAFCRRRHRAPGLAFLEGDAEDLPLPDASVDAVTNVEASFCYGDIDRFLAEVRRVLRPGGHFLYADLRHDHEVLDLLAALERSGLTVIEAEDITAGVLRALELDCARRQELIEAHAPRLLRRALGTFAGVDGSRIPRKLAGREMLYLRFAARKPPDPA